MKLRKATWKDSELLLRWRNDELTRRMSFNQGKVSKRDHAQYMQRVMGDPHTKVFIAEVRGKPVGTAKAVYSRAITLLSWTIAPEYRGRGYGTKMVKLLVQKMKRRKRLCAEVKTCNLRSVNIALSAGLQPKVVVYER